MSNRGTRGDRRAGEDCSGSGGGLTSLELEAFQSVIAARLGLRFDDSRSRFLFAVLTRRLEARRLTAHAYLSVLRTGLEEPGELDALARELTVSETYFFRHVDQFNALSEVALPQRLAARAAAHSYGLRLLSAGCASGEEAYSLAILLRERGIEPDFKVTIQGVDLNTDALSKAQRAVYSPWSLRETPAPVVARWFSQEGRDFRLARSICDAVRFDQHNLLLPEPTLLPRAGFDVIFCRNVLMYFTPEHAAAIATQLARALAPGGFLFLGHAETLRGLPDGFELRNTHNTFYYQRLVTDPAPD